MYHYYGIQISGVYSEIKSKGCSLVDLLAPGIVLQGEGGDSPSDGQEGGCTTRRRHGHSTVSIPASARSAGSLRTGGGAARGSASRACTSARARGGGGAGASVPGVLLELRSAM